MDPGLRAAAGSRQGLSRRRNALRPPRARVAGLSGQAPYTWGPSPGGSVSARSDPRTQPGRAPVPRLYQADTIVQARNSNSVIAGGSGTEKFPAALSTGVCLPDERSDGIRGEANGLARSPSPPGEARGPGPPLPPRSCWRAPRGGGLGQVGPGPHLTWNPRPAPARGLRVLLRHPPPAPLAPPRARGLLGGSLLPAHLRRGEQGAGPPLFT
ncbi:unnamed protein product [Rangifer tarandus platyrhynchus]|uniref:Uncharacterized protein n=2 Tax=Rangifer tarandus platyrhynchus TaxID=3082113 RepID=A0ACB0EIH6_RANTA|nr:unnamed protein product [Rangifer tarandus platyrhynchus]CAI9700455.1 unnamed protein product [Rangifer tarandus platyrhynchus]